MTVPGRTELPRVLFLTSSAFNRVTGGGITFGNLFRDWPKDRIATAHNDPVPTTDETCERYFALSSEEIRKWGPLEEIAPAAAPGSFADLPQAGAANANALHGVLKAIKRAAFGNALPDVGQLSPRLAEWIEAFQPQVLYSILGSNAMMDLVLKIHSRFGVPLVVHVMDDWLATAYRGGVLAPLARARMERLFREVVRVAACRLGISEAMCSAYEARYGAPFAPIQNAIDARRWAVGSRRGALSPEVREVVYVGSILPFAQLDSLVECCEAVARLGHDGEPVRLAIYSPAHDLARCRERLLAGPNISVAETIQDDTRLFERLQSADVLLLPVNFDAHTVEYIRYSMPTKVPAYLAAGTPILAYGPPEVAQIRYASEAGWAHVVPEHARDALTRGLRRILGDMALREQLVARALEVARERHDAETVRPRFQALLATAATGASR